MRPTEIIIHCANTPNYSERYGIKDIDSWHAARGFKRKLWNRTKARPSLKSVGYHFVINVDGSVREGRAENEQGAHCLGHNHKSLGICLIGTDRYSPLQWHSLVSLVADLCKRHGIKVRDIHGHREFSPKSCPGFDVQEWAGKSPIN